MLVQMKDTGGLARHERNRRQHQHSDDRCQRRRAEPRAGACRSFDLSRALLDVVLILKLLVRGTLRLRFIIVIGGDEP